MSRKKKILILSHLCLACTYLCWLLIQPYVKEIVSYKSQIALYEMVHERTALFAELSADDQRLILQGYATTLQHKTPSFWEQMGHLFFTQTPPFALAWLFFSLVTALLLLFHIEGAALSTWILPVVVVGYAYFLYTAPHHPQGALFPKEGYVLETYVTAEEQTGISRRDSLLLGWHRYLVQEWAHETPSLEQTVYQEQLEKGLFAFNIARLKWIAEGKGDEVIVAGFAAPPSILRIGCYLIWNFLFAWMINRKEKTSVYAVPSAPSC